VAGASFESSSGCFCFWAGFGATGGGGGGAFLFGEGSPSESSLIRVTYSMGSVILELLPPVWVGFITGKWSSETVTPISKPYKNGKPFEICLKIVNFLCKLTVTNHGFFST